MTELGVSTKFSVILGHLQSEYDVEDYLETGIFGGDTIMWASQRFKKVYGIEIKEEYVVNVRKKLRDYGIGNVRLYVGDSGVYLPIVLRKLAGMSVVLLDAHFYGSSIQEATSLDVQCPIARELRSLREASVRHIILIDDLNMFRLRILPDGTDLSQFPTFDWISEYLSPEWTMFHQKNFGLAIPADIAHRSEEWLSETEWSG